MDIHGETIAINASKIIDQYGLIQYIIPFVDPSVVSQFDAQNLKCFWNDEKGEQNSEDCAL